MGYYDTEYIDVTILIQFYDDFVVGGGDNDDMTTTKIKHIIICQGDGPRH
jgi:hypothetical protein